MSTIFDLSNYDIYRLQSIDPMLNDDWRTTLQDILPKLDKDSQKSVFLRLLKPRGILHDKVTKKFFVNKPASLADTLNHLICNNQSLISTSKQMLFLLTVPTEPIAILEVADKIALYVDCNDH